MMSPLILLLILIALTIGARIAQRLAIRRRQDVFRQLAREWEMHFSAADHLRLAERLAAAFPVPGAAAIHVTDLIYGSRQHQHRFIFTVDYTLGLTGPRRRVRRAAACVEQKSPGPLRPGLCPIVVSTHTPLIDQYRPLHEVLYKPEAQPNTAR